MRSWNQFGPKMATPASLLLILTLIISTHTLLTGVAQDNPTADLISHLQTLRRHSPAGVIHLTDPLLQRILSLPTPRPFSFLVFFDAKEASLHSLKSEFSLLSKSFLSNNPRESHSRLFFFDVDHGESTSAFNLFAVKSLPNIKLISSTAVDMTKDSIKMGPADLSKAESMAQFVESEINITIAPIHRPPKVSKKRISITIAFLLISAKFVLQKVSAGKTLLHSKKLWMVGAIFVYFFSVSGTMYNIIRGMPMFIPDMNHPGRVIFFLKRSGMQFGLEGFAVGFLFTIVGLMLAMATHLLPSAKSKNVQNLGMFFVLVVSYWAVAKVVYLDNWKTGYRVHGYWPSSWRRRY